MITGQDIRHAYDTIKPYLRRTPVVQVDLGGLTGSRAGPPGAGVVLKLEQLQCAGSFKTRGAFANLLLRTVPSAGVVAASGGNHGVAVAYAAHRLGKPAKIFVPTVSAPPRSNGSDTTERTLVVGGDRYADALAAAHAWATGSTGAYQPEPGERVAADGVLPGAAHPAGVG